MSTMIYESEGVSITCTWEINDINYNKIGYCWLRTLVKVSGPNWSWLKLKDGLFSDTNTWIELNGMRLGEEIRDVFNLLNEQCEFILGCGLDEVEKRSLME